MVTLKFIDWRITDGPHSHVVGKVVDPSTGEFITGLTITNPHVVEWFRNASGEFLEEITTFHNCEVVEVQVGEHVRKTFVAHGEDDDTGEMYPLW